MQHCTQHKYNAYHAWIWQDLEDRPHRTHNALSIQLVPGKLQFTVCITFCHIHHQCMSQVIHCLLMCKARDSNEYAQRNTNAHMHQTVHRPHMLTLTQHMRNSWHMPNTNHRQTKHANDPSAGSPTETLLRLLLPLGDRVCPFYAIPDSQVLQQSK